MSRLLCWLCAPSADMGAALSQVQDGDVCDDAGLPAAPPTMADVIRERKKKAGGAALGTLRRRIVAAARRPRDSRPDRGCEHARFIRSVVSRWRLAEVFLLCEELEAGAALRDLVTQAELAREPAPALPMALARALNDRWWCDVELVGAGWAVCAHRCILVARSSYFRRLLARYPPGVWRVPLDGGCAGVTRAELDACLCALYAGGLACVHRPRPKWEHGSGAGADLDIIGGDMTNSNGTGCGCSVAAARLSAMLGVSCDSLHHDMRYLLEAGNGMPQGADTGTTAVLIIANGEWPATHCTTT
ncbi:hypothetical protein evm_013124 [Chilo suppressalis]|nr:hypothetical protein evm_013124 [Chilo suppressalis]